jgi:glycosyltransferase involved in cell wall biosynthesis
MCTSRQESDSQQERTRGRPVTRPVTISIIIPVYNGQDSLARCLHAVHASPYSNYETLVVDDVSADDSVRIAEVGGATVLSTEVNSGPAKARNLGAQAAQGEILYFLDADVEMHPGNLERIAGTFAEHEDVAALFGSYDDEPDAQTFISQYKNLCHHYVHQHGKREAITFWSGCGAIRRNIFLQHGGFDQEKYKTPAIEDIELGYRLTANGHRIVLDPDVQVKHLKKWTFGAMLRADILGRAIPWSMLMLDYGSIPNDLNVQFSQRIAAVSACLVLLLLVLSPFNGWLLWPAVAFVLLVILLNKKFFLFLLNRRGVLFMLGSIPLQLFYYIYSTVTFAGCAVVKELRRPAEKESG